MNLLSIPPVLVGTWKSSLSNLGLSICGNTSCSSFPTRKCSNHRSNAQRCHRPTRHFTISR